MIEAEPQSQTELQKEMAWKGKINVGDWQFDAMLFCLNKPNENKILPQMLYVDETTYNCSDAFEYLLASSENKQKNIGFFEFVMISKETVDTEMYEELINQWLVFFRSR